MAQQRGAAGQGDQEPEATGGSPAPDPSDAPELYGNNGLVGEGRYRLTHRLGRGGMAEVFAAEDVRLGRPVAVKLLRADLAEDPVSKARFTREAQSVAGLNHHAVVAVYDSGEEHMPMPGTGGRGSMVPYMVMELVHGRTIRELLIDADAPPTGQALVIVSGVLEALAYSHQHGIVHRDIKPANVIITESGAVKVMDFGIARALHGAAQTMTATGMVMGTPQYLSPEQALGKTVDTRSDLYAVGCLLYELLALRPPFVGETPLSVVYQHVQDIARPPSEVNAAVPPELDGLVMRSLAKDPDDRFQTAEEMRGLVQYALRMLEEHGGHTGGLWNTGPASAGTTPPMGSPTRGAAGANATTSQLSAPMLLGDPGAGAAHRAGGPGDGDPYGDGGSGPGGRRRGRLILVALLAVVAIGTGVLVAANLGGDDEGDGGPDTSETTTDDANSGEDGETEGRGDDPSEPETGLTEDEGEDDGDDEDTWETEPTTPEETEAETTPEETETETTAPETTEETTPETTEPEPTETEPETEDPTEEPTEDPTTEEPPPTDDEGDVGEVG